MHTYLWRKLSQLLNKRYMTQQLQKMEITSKQYSKPGRYLHCIREKNNIQIVNVNDLDIVMPMHNLTE